MSTLLEQASLVMIPSGYKEDVVYSQIPTDGSGDLTFTRASNGTRVNSAGLVEFCPWNLIQYSEQFTNGVWAPKNGTFTDNFATAPNGTQTAAKMVATDSDPFIYQAFNGQNIDYTVTCWVKATGTAIGKNCSIRIAGNAVFVAMTGEWQQLTITGNINGSVNVGVEAPESATIGEIVYIWGFQVNIGSTAKPYFPTTDRLNVPRLTYQNGGGGCPSLLLEKQSTNLVTYSEQFDNAAFSTANNNGTVTRTANYGISPDGTQNADRIQLTRGSGSFDYAQVYQQVSTTSGTHTFSCWIKSLSGTPSIGWAYDGAVWNVVTLTNEWVRYTWTTSTNANPSANLIIYGSLATPLSADFLVWGYQIEASSYATSYIPTTSSSATRVADACYKTGISSLIGQTEGTLFADIVRTQSTANDLFWITLSDGSINNWLFFGTEGTGGRFYVRASNTVIFDQYPAISLGRHKLALAYKSGSIAVYIDGAQLFTSSSTFTIGSLTGFALGQNQSTLTGSVDTSGQVNQAILFPTRLTNAELASLTTI